MTCITLRYGIFCGLRDGDEGAQYLALAVLGGADETAMLQQAGISVGKILKGAKPLAGGAAGVIQSNGANGIYLKTNSVGFFTRLKMSPDGKLVERRLGGVGRARNNRWKTRHDTGATPLYSLI